MKIQDTLALSSPKMTPFPNASKDCLESRIECRDWTAFEEKLTQDGYSVLPKLLTAAECRGISAFFPQEDLFRSRIVMERYAFGRGEYKYFGYPLPDQVVEMRAALYRYLAPIANAWHQCMRVDERFPETLEQFIAICHAAGQRRPTPLMLRYAAQDYCCLHQDLYGEHVFPLQVVFLLSQPGRDFDGGELLLTESDPKKPGCATVVPISQGDAVVFAVNSRPQRSSRGYYRVGMRHGVSRLHSGRRHTLGIIFHEAK